MVRLQLYDTATRSQREFVPLRRGAASIYVCGATVQGLPHIGHVRSGLNYDVMRRWLARHGLDVALVRNVTDIDDKILGKAAEAGRPWWEWAATHERAFDAAYAALGCLPPSIAPRATGHVPRMIELMQRLIDTGHAYAGRADGTGGPGTDVYFDVRSYPDYGGLSGQRVDEMQQGEDWQPAGKRNASDFTLWKAAKPGEPSWPTPWGPGRPGWHLECSAMGPMYLGPEFDVPGGGRVGRFHVTDLQVQLRRLPGRPVTASPGTGRTTRGSPSVAKRCRSRWATRCPSTCCCAGSGAPSCATTWWPRTTAR